MGAKQSTFCKMTTTSCIHCDPYNERHSFPERVVKITETFLTYHAEKLLALCPAFLQKTISCAVKTILARSIDLLPAFYCRNNLAWTFFGAILNLA